MVFGQCASRLTLSKIRDIAPSAISSRKGAPHVESGMALFGYYVLNAGYMFSYNPNTSSRFSVNPARLSLAGCSLEKPVKSQPRTIYPTHIKTIHLPHRLSAPSTSHSQSRLLSNPPRAERSSHRIPWQPRSRSSQEGIPCGW